MQAPVPPPDTEPSLPRRQVAAAQGWRWIVEAFWLFREAPLTFLMSTLPFFPILMLVGSVALLGTFAGPLLAPILSAGFIVAAIKIEHGDEASLADFFAGFKLAPRDLLMTGLWYIVMVMTIALSLVMVAVLAGVDFGGLSTLAEPASQGAPAAAPAVPEAPPDAANPADFSTGLVLLFGSMVLCSLPLALAYWLAPAYIIKAKLSVAEAMRESVMVGWQNKGAFLVYTLALAALAGLALIPFGLGLVVWVPLVSLSAYTCYRDMVGASPITPAEILVE